MKDRIVKFIEEEHLTAAEFADKIGVQRSSVSHVLNGRNNPGFSFIQKILEAFPAINSRWLLTGDGNMYEQNNNNVESDPSIDLFSTPVVSVPEPIDTPKNEVTDVPVAPDIKPTPKEVEDSTEPPIVSTKDKVIKRVLIFYEDHTFEDFHPAE